MQQRIDVLDAQLMEDGGTAEIRQSRITASQEMREMDHIAHMDLAQKEKVRWGVEGDENSGFFHGVINRKRRQLAIKGIMVEGQWVVPCKGCV